MPAWIPFIKVALPYLTPILSALPALTRKRSDRADAVVNQQISELQEAVKTNDERISALARSLEAAMVASAREIAQTRLIAMVSMCVALVCVAIAVLARFV
jgi:hypothetical protein